MKKILALLITVLVILSLAACTGRQVASGSVNNNAADSEFVADTADDTSDVSGEETPADSNNTAWRQYLKDYEAWVDQYIELLNKMKNNPTDTSLLTEYSKMLSETSKWSARAEEIRNEVLDSEAALEYASELTRIAGKLSDAMKK